MRVLVLGAGVVGVSTAYQLLKDGHEVTVVDRADEPAAFTSFANAGLVAPGHAYAWASPRAPGMMLRSLWRDDQAIRFRPRLDPRLWRWSLSFLRECTAERARLNTERKARLCLYSQKMLADVVAETGVDYDANQGGLVYFYRSEETFALAAKKCEILRAQGVAIEVLDAESVVARDPGLADAKDRIAGGLYAAGDESGDARLFTLRLAERCAEMGARFVMGAAVTALDASGGRIAAAVTSKGRIEADSYVLCLGVYSPHLVRRLGIRLPIYPIKGYSVTLPVEDGMACPRLGGVDEDNLLAYCPMGRRFRLTATAEFAGYDDSWTEADFRVMLAKAREVFPNAADYARPSYWAGLRPMTPTGLPIIDRSRFANLWINTGHGHMGWTMSCGAARICADLIGGREPALDRAGMTCPG